jgi:hypothetical protein
MATYISDSIQKSFAANPYYGALYNEVTTVSEMMSMPFDLRRISCRLWKWPP